MINPRQDLLLCTADNPDGVISGQFPAGTFGVLNVETNPLRIPRYENPLLKLAQESSNNEDSEITTEQWLNSIEYTTPPEEE